MFSAIKLSMNTVTDCHWGWIWAMTGIPTTLADSLALWSVCVFCIVAPGPSDYQSSYRCCSTLIINKTAEWIFHKWSVTVPICSFKLVLDCCPVAWKLPAGCRAGKRKRRRRSCELASGSCWLAWSSSPRCSSCGHEGLLWSVGGRTWWAPVGSVDLPQHWAPQSGGIIRHDHCSLFTWNTTVRNTLHQHLNAANRCLVKTPGAVIRRPGCEIFTRPVHDWFVYYVGYESGATQDHLTHCI